jgi:hypothetical protein
LDVDDSISFAPSRSIGGVLATIVFLILAAAVSGLFLVLDARYGGLARVRIGASCVEHVSKNLRVHLLQLVDHFIAVFGLAE